MKLVNKDELVMLVRVAVRIRTALELLPWQDVDGVGDLTDDEKVELFYTAMMTVIDQTRSKERELMERAEQNSKDATAAITSFAKRAHQETSN